MYIKEKEEQKSNFKKEYKRELDHVAKTLIPLMTKSAELRFSLCGPTESEIFEHGLYKIEYYYENVEDGPQIIVITKNDQIFSELFMHDLWLTYHKHCMELSLAEIDKETLNE